MNIFSYCFKLCVLFGFLVGANLSWSDPNKTIDNAGFGSLVIFSGVFGDTGNYASLHGELPPVFWQNRFANGPVVADYFAENLGFNAEPSLHWTGEEGGYNYSTRNSWAALGGEYGVNEMVSAYLTRVDNAIPPDALIFFWSGGHDVIEAISTPGDVPYYMIDDAVAGLELQLRRLIASGAQHIFAPTYADTSFSPAYQRRGIADRVSHVTNVYNHKFRKMLNRVERQTGQRIYRFDFDKYVSTLVQSHRYFGLENAIDPCWELQAVGQCNPNTFMFLSEVLITSKTHQLIADAFTQDLLQQIQSCEKGNWHPRAKRSVCGRQRHQEQDHHWHDNDFDWRSWFN